MKRLLSMFSLAALACSSIFTGVARADDVSSPEEVALSVYTADDPVQAARDLTRTEAAMLADRMAASWTSVVTEVKLVERAPDPQELESLEATSYVTTAAAKCYSQYEYRKWYDLAINTGDTWMTAHWCSNGSKITSYRLSGQGGVGYKGITYTGLGSRSTRDMGWEVRQAQQFKFTLWLLGAMPCMQIRGGATGKYSSQGSCNLS